jgi:GH24 family phage-related lysozyme (muramidase)
MLKMDQYDFIRTSYRVYGKKIKEIGGGDRFRLYRVRRGLAGVHYVVLVCGPVVEENGPMRWAELAVKLIALFEGCEKKGKDGKIHPYLDKLAKPPVWTRGYGRTYGISEKSEPVTSGQALDELRNGIKKYGGECLKLALNLALKDQCFAAVASWSWNCGIDATLVSLFKMRSEVRELFSEKL